MSGISQGTLRSLESIFGDSVRADRIERKMYSFDIGAMPSLVRPFVPSGLAGAVVRPADEGQVVELLRLAEKEGLAVVPRGMATSGYGGALPQKGAIVADMSSAMNAVLEIDEAALTVRVQPGAIWENVERAVGSRGLALRLYPSSSPSSTVAGWLAQGGAGFGSFEWGFFKDNVVSARVVGPGGQVRVYEGEELADFVADAEGITGIITEVTVSLRRLEPEEHRAFSFPDAASLSAALVSISGAGLEVWSLTFLNPESVRLKKRLPHRHGHPYEVEHPHADPEVPDAYVLIAAYPKARASALASSLSELVRAAGGTDLEPEVAEHEWEQRFSPMRLKRIGPSIIPTEVIVPLTELGSVMDEISEKVKQPFVVEGMVTKGDEVVLLGFIPHDERSFAFNLAFALALTVIEIARRHGGRAYSTGLYFRKEAASVLGEGRMKRLATRKSALDPQGIMNPGKVLGSGAIDALMGAASALEPLVRPIANAAKVSTGDLTSLTKGRRGIPGEVAFMAYACARCGYCVPTCEQFSGRGWESHSPRGKYAFIREVLAGRERFNRQMVDTFLVCTTCEMCNTRCQLQLPVEHNWMAMRNQLVGLDKRGTFPPFEMMAASLRGERDIWAGRKEHRADWVPEDVAPKLAKEGETLYFAGCTASFVNKDVAEATVRLLDAAGVGVAYMGEDEACCGIPMKVAGKWDLFEEIFEHNVSEARKRGAKTIVTSCPACGLVWKEFYADLARKRGEDYEFEVKHYSEVIADAIAEGALAFDTEVPGKVTFHDSCHMGRAQGVYDPPRALLNALPGCEVVEMEHNREDGLCCGSVLTLVGEKPVAPKLGGARLQEAIDVGADTVVALCPCCQVQLRDSNEKNLMGLHVTDLARYVARGLGHEIKDHTEYSMYMWGFFDVFIDLMRPEQMAALMERIFPQMMDAMPFGMKPMMKAMKYVPGGLDLMERVMPVMFPMLVGGIMEKVMPDMIAAVREHVGVMPEDMDSLMPDLLPATLESLMPTYLPQLIPHVTPRMIGYIRERM